MKPIATLPRDEARRLAVLLFDLDDTLLTRGRLEEDAYRALFRLRESGLALVAVTGRPLAWAEVLARQWPVEGIVAENGAVACALEGERLTVLDFAGSEREPRRRALGAIVAEIRKRFPELRSSDDVGGRRSDFTFDVGEHERVPDRTRDAVQRLARSLGARTVTSSVHVHVSLDGEDKATGAVRFLAARLGLDRTVARARAGFIGDSENDAACFGAFGTTVGVANLRGRFTVPPRFVTTGERGAGFAEAARTLVEKRAPLPDRGDGKGMVREAP